MRSKTKFLLTILFVLGSFILLGNTKVYASIFNPEEENPVLLPIETDEEWKLIEGILTSLSSEENQNETAE